MSQAHSWVNDLTMEYFSLFAQRHFKVTPEGFVVGQMEVDAPRLSDLKTHFFVDYEVTAQEQAGERRSGRPVCSDKPASVRGR